MKRLGEGVGEIKRLFVVPKARGRGLGGRLLAEVEAAARGLGYGRVRLETGPHDPAAQALFESAGYTAIHNHSSNPAATYWGETAL